MVVLPPSVRAQLQVSLVGTIDEQPVVAQTVLTRPPAFPVEAVGMLVQPT